MPDGQTFATSDSASSRDAASPSRKDRFPALMRRELDCGLQRGAGIESGAVAARKIHRGATPPVATSVPLRPINSLRSQVALETLSFVAAKATRPANSLLKGLLREDWSPPGLIDLGYDVGRRVSALHAEYQLVIQA